DGLKVRWAYRDPRSGWLRTDAIPLTITGGQEEGWRGVAYKRNYTPGQWKVNIETDDGREVGNIRFVVIEDLSSEPRTFQEEVIGASIAHPPPRPRREGGGEGTEKTVPPPPLPLREGRSEGTEKTVPPPPPLPLREGGGEGTEKTVPPPPPLPLREGGGE